MTGGVSARQLGITPALIDSYGEVIFSLSNNHQLRRGDPVRCKDFQAIERDRPELGMSDAQIAAHLGLTPGQVTYIRNLVERRQFKRNRYHRLNALGGGRRFRADRLREPEPMGQSALRLRGAMRYEPALVKRYVTAGYWRNDTLSGWLEDHASSRPEQVAIEQSATEQSPIGQSSVKQSAIGQRASGAFDERVSFRELRERVETRARGLYEIGLRPGDVVAVQLPNTIDFVVAYLAIARLGAVMTTLYLTHRAAEFETLLRFSGAKAVIVGARLGDFDPAGTATALAARLPSLTHVIVSGPPVEPPHIVFGALGAHSAALPPEVHPTGADPLLLLFTSGTTSAPKAVPLSYQNLLSNARLSAPEHGLAPDDRIASAAPFGHLYALYSLHLALWLGATTVLLPVFSPPALAQVLHRLRPTALFAAPAHMAAAVGTNLATVETLESVKLLVMSGSAVPPHLARCIQNLMPTGHVSQLWGMTETQAGLYTRPLDNLEIVSGSAGRPGPGTEVRIVDEHGTEVPNGSDGELQLRGPLVFPGYLENEAANQASFSTDGWFSSGDIARRVERLSC